MNKLAIVTTHPIQYYAPLFQRISKEQTIALKVFYSRDMDEVEYDDEFKRNVTWDIPLTEGYHHHFFPCFTRKGVSEMTEAIRQFHPDAILVFGWNFPGHLSVIRHFSKRIPVWFRGDSTLLNPMPKWKAALRKIWLHHVYSYIDLAFYVGQANKRYYEWAGLQSDQLIHAPHAVNNEFFHSERDSNRKGSAELRHQFQIPDKAAVLLFVGKLDPIKQPIELARAFLKSQSFAQGVKAHLVFVGTGQLHEVMLKEFDHSPIIHFAGFVNQRQLPAFYQLGNFICLSSISETWGLAINEGIASGLLPIVTDRVGCGEDLVTDKGAIMPAESPEQWPAMLARNLSKTISQKDIASAQDILGTYADFITAINCAFKENLPYQPTQV
jgi:glycosyltransferase involved in cell wall biosynthesis